MKSTCPNIPERSPYPQNNGRPTAYTFTHWGVCLSLYPLPPHAHMQWKGGGEGREGEKEKPKAGNRIRLWCCQQKNRKLNWDLPNSRLILVLNYTTYIVLKRQERRSLIFLLPWPQCGFNSRIPSHTAAGTNKGSGSRKSTNFGIPDYEQGASPTHPSHTPTSPKSWGPGQ